MKLYETFDYRTKQNYWWTQRDKNSNCFEIRQSGGKFVLLVNEIKHSIFNSLIDAEAKTEEMWA